MVWANSKERPKRYLISVGRDRLREKILSELWEVCDMENSTMADEVWDALYMHVERHRTRLDASKGSGISVELELEPSVDMSMPEGKNVFDDVVLEESISAHTEVVEEVLDEERSKPHRVDSRNMFGHKGG